MILYKIKKKYRSVLGTDTFYLLLFLLVFYFVPEPFKEALLFLRSIQRSS